MTLEDLKKLGDVINAALGQNLTRRGVGYVFMVTASDGVPGSDAMLAHVASNMSKEDQIKCLSVIAKRS